MTPSMLQPPGGPPPFDSLASYGGDLPDPSDPVGRAIREFLANSWEEAQGLLARTELIRVTPLPGEGPRSFSFSIDRPYRRRLPSGVIALDPGPVTGVIHYHGMALQLPQDAHPVVVFVTSEGFHHPNVSRKLQVMCLGDLPRHPLPLEALLQHIYSVAAYQNLGFDPPLDRDAARYFLTDPDAFDGLRPVAPLY